METSPFPVLKFEICDADGSQSKEIQKNIIKIGTDKRGDIVISDPNASRMHAVIEAGAESQLVIMDLGNMISTRVNGSAISKTTLFDNDVIEIGSATITLLSGSPKPPSPQKATDEGVMRSFARGLGSPSDDDSPPQNLPLVRKGLQSLHDTLETRLEECQKMVKYYEESLGSAKSMLKELDDFFKNSA